MKTYSPLHDTMPEGLFNKPRVEGRGQNRREPRFPFTKGGHYIFRLNPGEMDERIAGNLACHDIARSGLGAFVDQEVDPGKQMEILLYVPGIGDDNCAVTLLGRVAWCSKTSAENRYAVGLITQVTCGFEAFKKLLVPAIDSRRQ
jgi:hypothetical protein